MGIACFTGGYAQLASQMSMELTFGGGIEICDAPKPPPPAADRSRRRSWEQYGVRFNYLASRAQAPDVYRPTGRISPHRIPAEPRYPEQRRDSHQPCSGGGACLAMHTASLERISLHATV